MATYIFDHSVSISVTEYSETVSRFRLSISVCIMFVRTYVRNEPILSGAKIKVKLSGNAQLQNRIYADLFGFNRFIRRRIKHKR